MVKSPKAKASKAAASKGNTKKVRPRYLKRGTSYTLGLHDVVRALKVIEEKNHLDKFVRASKRNKTSVSVNAKTVNFVKDFMVKNNMHDHPVGKHIVNAMVAPAEDPFKPCNFGGHK
jgi:hypothetical protein